MQRHLSHFSAPLKYLNAQKNLKFLTRKIYFFFIYPELEHKRILLESVVDT